MRSLKAFRWKCGDLSGDLSGVVAARSAGKARYHIYLSANDAGYPVEFEDILVRRAPEYDLQAAELNPGCEVVGEDTKS